MKDSADYNEIHNNLIKNNGYGIYLDGASHNFLHNNVIITSSADGFTCYSSHYNVFENNFLTNDDFDFEFHNCGFNIIQRNNARDYQIASGSYNNYISNNSIMDHFGIYGDNNIIEYNNHEFGDITKTGNNHEKNLYMTDYVFFNNIFDKCIDNANLLRYNIISKCYIMKDSHVINNQIGRVHVDTSYTIIEKNNIIEADFEYRPGHYFSFSFNENYWFKELNRPKAILGNILIIIVVIPVWWEYLIRIPVWKFDMTPVQEPYIVDGSGII
jgi:parallel beta-helix repeat protein